MAVETEREVWHICFVYICSPVQISRITGQPNEILSF